MRMSLILIMLPPLNEYLTGALGRFSIACMVGADLCVGAQVLIRKPSGRSPTMVSFLRVATASAETEWGGAVSVSCG